MTVVYFDSSALVKLMVDEVGTELAGELWSGCDAAFTSPLAYPEVCGALVAGRRCGDLSARAALAATADWEDRWPMMWRVELAKDVALSAGRLAGEHALSGADAVHLASALAIGSDVVVAAWDRRLHRAAAESGLAVVPARLD